MVRKNPAKNVPTNIVPGSPAAAWGLGKARRHVPSGQKLVFKPDELGILQFMGQKDISDKVLDKEGNPQSPGSVVYLTFFDGKKVVSMPTSYSMSKYDFTADCFYMIYHAGNVQTREEFNPMKDFDIAEFGSEQLNKETGEMEWIPAKLGDTVPSDPKVTGTETIQLTYEVIGDLNYSKLNYPLRKF